MKSWFICSDFKSFITIFNMFFNGFLTTIYFFNSLFWYVLKYL